MDHLIYARFLDESIDWFFQQNSLAYEDRRNCLKERCTRLAIDYITRYHVEENFTYPPKSAKSWLKLLDSDISKNVVIVLINYLILDMNMCLIGEDENECVENMLTLHIKFNEFKRVPHILGYPTNVTHLAHGLWAIDNRNFDIAITELSYPSVDIAAIFGSSTELVNIIVEALTVDHQLATDHRRADASEMQRQAKLALFVRYIHNQDGSITSYEPNHVKLLILCDQVVEALKYQRRFKFTREYKDILHSFFELCERNNASKDLRLLCLTEEEETEYNRFLVPDSRSVTPNTQKSSSQQSTRKSRPKRGGKKSDFSDTPARNTRSKKRIDH